MNLSGGELLKNTNNKIKIVIIVLSVMLALSLIALAALVVSRILTPRKTTVVVPDNVINFNENA